MIPLGCVHGRFQIFHHDHARYLREAFSRFDYVYIGLTACEGRIPAETGTTTNSSRRPSANVGQKLLVATNRIQYAIMVHRPRWLSAVP